MKTRVFTCGVLMRTGKLLILKRRPDDDTYPGMWDCLGGHFKPGESAEECMKREAREESGMNVKIVRPGPLIEYIDQYGRAVAVPFLISGRSPALRLSEHTEHRWVRPRDLGEYEIVPDLAKALEAFGLLPR